MARASSIDKLPPDIRDKVNDWLRDPGISQLQTTERTNLILEEIGVDYRISKSSVHRYAKRIEKISDKLRQAREVADVWDTHFGGQPQDKLGQMIIDTLQAMAFETSSHMAEGDGPISPKALKDLALAIQRMQSAATMNEERESLIRKKQREATLEEAADIVERNSEAMGMGEEQVALWREKFLGVK